MSEAQSPFRLSTIETSRDDRGWVSNLLDFIPLPPSAIHNIHLCELQPGAIRGNHMHGRQTEWIVVSGGPVTIAVAAGERREQHTFSGEQPVMLMVRPGAAHAVRYDGAERAYLTAITDTPYDFTNPDVTRVALLT
jgi:dTDP-4-dehydrorhamnose 3,5-epimerase-like enzyme